MATRYSNRSRSSCRARLKHDRQTTPTLSDGTASSGPDVPAFDLLRTAEIIEGCRAHAASLNELADVASRALYECYEYERDEPHLGLCCAVVRRLLGQVHAALAPLGILAMDVDPHMLRTEIASGCKEQMQLLVLTQHVVRSIIHILRSAAPSTHDQVLLALNDLENGICSVVTGLESAAMNLLTPLSN